MLAESSWMTSLTTTCLMKCWSREIEPRTGYGVSRSGCYRPASTPPKRDRDTRTVRQQWRRFSLAPQVLAELIHIVTDPKRFSHPLSMDAARDLAQQRWNAIEVDHVFPDSDATAQFIDWHRRHQLHHAFIKCPDASCGDQGSFTANWEASFSSSRCRCVRSCGRASFSVRLGSSARKSPAVSRPDRRRRSGTHSVGSTRRRPRCEPLQASRPRSGERVGNRPASASASSQ